MATTISKYRHVTKVLVDGTVNPDSDTLMVALVTSAYTYDPSHTSFDADASAAEVVAGDGYTAGGEIVSGRALTTDVSGVTTLSADNVSWSALTKTFRGAVLYRQGTSNGIVDPLLAYILFDDTPADVQVNGITFQIEWSASGILTVSGS